MKLWIGGSSNLSQTYFNIFPPIVDTNHDVCSSGSSISIDEESWILIGCERIPPSWITVLQQQQQKQQQQMNDNQVKFHYIYCELSQLVENNHELQRVMNDIQTILVKSIHRQDCTNHPAIQWINSIIIGIRPSLVTYRTNDAAIRYNNMVVNGLYILLQQLILQQQQQQYCTTTTTSHRKLTIIHISSIAAINHIATQHLRSVPRCTTTLSTVTSTTADAAATGTATTEPSSIAERSDYDDDDDPSYTELQYPYDRFKRQCEMMIEQLVKDMNNNNNNNTPQEQQQQQHKDSIQYTNIRLGAIFSDTYTCIQCTSLWLQVLFFGPYLSTYIDCNSSYNVSQLIHEILVVTSSSSFQPLRPIYYYTRCVSQYPYPIKYGEYFRSYKKVYYGTILSYFIPILIPHLLIEYGVVHLLHSLTVFLQLIHRQCRTVKLPSFLLSLILPPYIESIDYLLQVTLNEHTFDMKETIQDFPNILQLEETMEECFRRRQRQRSFRIQNTNFVRNFFDDN